MVIHALAVLTAGLAVAAADPVPPRLPGPADQRLARAFPGIDLSGMHTKLMFATERHEVVIAASEMRFEADGRVRLTDFTLAHFTKAEGAAPAQPTTVRSPFAVFRFDGPVRDEKDLGKRKVVAVELPGGVEFPLPKP